jgi:hypothetical protein
MCERRVSTADVYCDVESKHTNCHIITFLYSLFPNTGKCEMLPLETKQSGGILLHHSDLRLARREEECFQRIRHAIGVTARKITNRNGR